MKWFKHISDSLDDPFIFDLISRFGSDGYLVFFGILEIYSREFKYELNWNLTVTRSYLRQKLQKRQDTLVIKILKHIQNSGKWTIDIQDNYVTVFIPKFIEMLDDWTRRKLRSSSELTPKILRTNKIKKKKKNKDKETTQENIVRPDFIPEKIWKRFLNHRKNVKAPIESGSHKHFFRKFEIWKDKGFDPETVVNLMVEKGWRGFEPEWLKKDTSSSYQEICRICKKPKDFLISGECQECRGEK